MHCGRCIPAYPKYLAPGGTIGLLAPSSGVEPQHAQKAIAFLCGLGFQVKAAGNLTDNYGGYMAGDEKVRAEWINRMFADPEVDAIFCVRGGSGGSREVRYLDLELIKSHPKIFAGYSDVTVFHLVFNQICCFVTLHGPMVTPKIMEHFESETGADFIRTLAFMNAKACGCTRCRMDFHNPAGYPLKVLKPGRGAGILTGGNMAVLCASLGTPYELDTQGKILFIEEIDEAMHRIDRMVFQLRNAGKFRDCAGLLIGQFINTPNPDMPSFTEIDVFRDALKGCDIPVLYNLQAGHGLPMMTLPLGACCRMDTEAKTIVFG